LGWADSLGLKIGLGVMPRSEGGLAPTRSGFGLGEVSLIFFLNSCRAWLGVECFSLCWCNHAGGIISGWEVEGRICWSLETSATVRDQASMATIMERALTWR